MKNLKSENKNERRVYNAHSINPSFVIMQYDAGRKVKNAQKFNASKKTPMELVMNYIAKQIQAIDKARKELHKKYPNLLTNKL